MPRNVPMSSSPAASKRMKANISKGTGLEMKLRRALMEAGLRGYRLNYRGAPGSPDIAYVGKKVAIFAHGCFWHGCPKCKKRLPKSNREFWEKKIERNKERDEEKESALRNAGWTVIIVWECEIKSDIENVVRKIKRVHLAK